MDNEIILKSIFAGIAIELFISIGWLVPALVQWQTISASSILTVPMFTYAIFLFVFLAAYDFLFSKGHLHLPEDILGAILISIYIIIFNPYPQIASLYGIIAILDIAFLMFDSADIMRYLLERDKKIL